MSETELARGFYFDEPKDTAPEWVVGKVSINKVQFLGWLEKQKENEKGYVRLDVKRSKEGKIYAALDTWKPSGDRREPAPAATVDMDDDLPFMTYERGWLV